MKNPFARMFHARDKPQDAVSSAPTFYFGTSASGKAVNPSTAIQVSAVYACVRVIAETIASLPFHVYEATNEGSRKATGHPLYRIIHDESNSELTSFILRETLMTHLLLWESYIPSIPICQVFYLVIITVMSFFIFLHPVGLFQVFRYKIEEITQADPLLAQREYTTANIQIQTLYESYKNSPNTLLYGAHGRSGYPISEVLQAVAYVIANDNELFGKRPKGYASIIERHISNDPEETVEFRIPDLLTPLVIFGKWQGCIGRCSQSRCIRSVDYSRSSE